MPPRLADLKAQAQEHYRAPLHWIDATPTHAWADVDHHVVSVMVDPPEGQPHIVIIRGRHTEPLKPTLETARQLAFKL